MNFVADESCAGPVIRALREAGRDVVAIAEVAKGASDEQVLERALRKKLAALLQLLLPMAIAAYQFEEALRLVKEVIAKGAHVKKEIASGRTISNIFDLNIMYRGRIQRTRG